MNQKGFTIISVLIAILLLAVGVTALAKTGASVIEAHSSTANRTVALSIGRGHMEVVRSRSPFVITSEPAVAVNEEGQIDINGNFTREVTLTQVARNLVEIVVVVDFPLGRLPVELVTLVYVPPAQLSATSTI